MTNSNLDGFYLCFQVQKKCQGRDKCYFWASVYAWAIQSVFRNTKEVQQQKNDQI